MEIQEFVNGAESLRGGLLKQAMHYLMNDSDAEDAVQETLLKLWIARERIADVAKMQHMASVVCRNVSLNMLRDARQNVRMESLEYITMQTIRKAGWRIKRVSVRLSRA